MASTRKAERLRRARARRQKQQQQERRVRDLEQAAIALHRRGQVDEALAAFQLAVEADSGRSQTHNNLGNVLLDLGRVDEAAACYRRAVQLDPELAVAWFNLGNAHRCKDQLADAADAYHNALSRRPDHAATHYNLALVLQSLGQDDEAIDHYRRAIAAAPSFAQAHNNLGNALQNRGDSDEAIGCYRRAIEAEPRYPQALNNLGLALRDQGDLAEAIHCFEQAVQAAPSYAEARYHLGAAHNLQMRPDLAVGHLERAVELNATLGEDAYDQLGSALTDVGRIDEAVAAYDRALQQAPGFWKAHYHAGLALKKQGRVEEASRRFHLAIAIEPQDVSRYEAANLLPVVYDSTAQIQAVRSAMAEQIALLRAEGVRLDSTRQVVNTNFLLAYQGENDRDLQAAISSLWDHPDLRSTRNPVAGSPKRIQVGFLSSHFRDHSVGRALVGLIANLSRDAFEVSVLAIGRQSDKLARSIEQAADRYVVLPRKLDAAIPIVLDQCLDALIYPDIGMEPLTSSLARTRLAPVQAVMWGHPVTTGMPTIDYFVSSELLELDDAQDHYTERLVKLKTLPTFYYRPESKKERKSRSEFGLAVDRHVYLCPQTPFKLHPDFDSLLDGILRRDPVGDIVLLESQPLWMETLRQRFADTISAGSERIGFLPRQDHASFLNLLATADVVLDPLHFGGGRSTYEALAMGTPVVTLPSQFLRGRVTLGAYRKMGMLDCVAEDAEHYVDLAVRLGTDSEYRKGVSDRIRETSAALFEDHEAVRQFEEFLQEAVEESTGREHSSSGPTIPSEGEAAEANSDDASDEPEFTMPSPPLTDLLQSAICPACGHHVAVPFFDGGHHPLATLAWPRTVDEAEAMPRLPHSFVRCVDCGHVYNSEFDYAKVPYSDKPNLMFNAGLIWSDHLRVVQQRILECLPQQPSIVEVGCGTGEFLAALATARPAGRYIGFDPNAQVSDGLIDARETLFDPAVHLSECRPDLIISRHVLEHLLNPLGFLQALAFAVTWEGLATRLLIEVPCIDRVFASGRTVDFFYEHNSHFTSLSLSRLLERCGAEVEFIETGYDDEVVVGLARFTPQPSQLDFANEAVAFRERAGRGRANVQRQLADLADTGRRIAIWGGTGKAAAFINQHRLDRERFPVVVDSDRDKADTFVPGTGQLIRFRDHLLESPVDAIVIASQWRAADIVLEIQNCEIGFERILIEHDGKLVDYFDADHPYVAGRRAA